MVFNFKLLIRLEEILLVIILFLSLIFSNLLSICFAIPYCDTLYTLVIILVYTNFLFNFINDSVEYSLFSSPNLLIDLLIGTIKLV